MQGGLRSLWNAAENNESSPLLALAMLTYATGQATPSGPHECLKWLLGVPQPGAEQRPQKGLAMLHTAGRAPPLPVLRDGYGGLQTLVTVAYDAGIPIGGVLRVLADAVQIPE
jgi:hypothetical protein